MAQGPERVLWSPKARQDLLHIWHYFARVASPDVADKLLRDIAAAGQRLNQRPLMGRTREEVMSGLRSVLVHPYTIFYRVADTGVEIARVLHERRNFSRHSGKNSRISCPQDGPGLPFAA